MDIRKKINNIPEAVIWRNGFFALFFLCFLMLFIFIIEPAMVNDTKITYKGLNESQINDIENMLDNVKPLYLNSARSITFYNESHIIKQFVLFGARAGGINRLGFIGIKWTDDMEWNKQVICHELSHDFTKIEKFSYDLMETNFCFEDRNIIEVNLE